MLCGQSEARSFRMMTLLIIWSHLIASVVLIFGIALDDIDVEVFESHGIVKFYVLCSSVLFVMPQSLALYGVYQKASLFLTPYIILLMTLISLLSLVMIIIVVGVIFDTENVLNEWASPNTVSHCKTMRDLWLTILGTILIITIASVCLFITYSYYKVLLKQEQLKRRIRAETFLPNQQADISSTAVTGAPPSRVVSEPPPATSQSPLNAAEDPPPPYSRAQSIIGQSYA